MKKITLKLARSPAGLTHVLKWLPDPRNVDIVKYRIFPLEGAVEYWLADVPSKGTAYIRRGVSPDAETHYAVCAMNTEGREGDRAQIIVR